MFIISNEKAREGLQSEKISYGKKWHFPLSLHVVYVSNGFLRWEMRAATAEGAVCLPSMVSLITV